MRLLLFLLAFFAIPFLTSAQSISGKIIDPNQNEIIGADILNITTGSHTHSGDQGKFRLINVHIGDTLQFHCLGFKSLSVVVKSLTEELLISLESRPISLDQVVVSSELNTLNTLAQINLLRNPVTSSQEILRKVPGLFIGQHAGGGKAEQIFLRGFDVDHGTDVAIGVDGMPVNMVSHAHGQGYADMHFVIPETIDKVDFGKGPYYAHVGNFNTAGYVNFKTKSVLEKNVIKAEVGQFSTRRVLGMYNVLNSSKHQGYIATEYMGSDGPFESPQNLNRLNALTRFSSKLSHSTALTFSASHFTSTWDASGQIPNRAVESGFISRFGAIDDTEGGETSRSNLRLSLDQNVGNHAVINNDIYYTNYAFKLFSNFTFFLNDSENGDQIKQKEQRHMAGLNSTFIGTLPGSKINLEYRVGLQLRTDLTSDSELSHTANRSEVLERYRLGDIHETNMAGFVSTDWYMAKWRINTGIRVDHFQFEYEDKLVSQNQSNSANSALVSPKLSVSYQYSNGLQFYTKAGQGFHSNDSRLSSGNGVDKLIPKAYGLDVGMIWKPLQNLVINSAIWGLHLEQEFVYVGDEGIIEPSGRTNRKGIDLGLNYEPITGMYLNVDANYTMAKSIDDDSSNDRIPLAPIFTVLGNLSYEHHSGLFGSIQFRHMGDRPALPDNSIIADGYSVVDLNIGCKLRSLIVGIYIQNVFNSDWNETQFATNSQLQGEPSPVEEIHFTPGTPFNIRGSVQYQF